MRVTDLLTVNRLNTFQVFDLDGMFQAFRRIVVPSFSDVSK